MVDGIGTSVASPEEEAQAGGRGVVFGINITFSCVVWLIWFFYFFQDHITLSNIIETRRRRQDGRYNEKSKLECLPCYENEYLHYFL